MHLGFVTADERGVTDACLTAVAARLAGRGLRLSGGIQVNLDRPGRDTCDMDLFLLPDGPQVKISQDLGPHAEGCRLDADALEGAVLQVAPRLTGADLLIVNKFGKQEQLGRGFVPLIAQALEAGLPVLVGVHATQMPAFRAFAGDLAEEIPADPALAADWLTAALAART